MLHDGDVSIIHFFSHNPKNDYDKAVFEALDPKDQQLIKDGGPENEKHGEPDNIKYSCITTFKKCLEREVSKGIAISNSKADIIMNSKSEHNQPAIHRTTVTREVRHGS